jgi:hypothetical protein
MGIKVDHVVSDVGWFPDEQIVVVITRGFLKRIIMVRWETK